MGEAFKRARAAAFDHQNHRHYQALVDGDLLRMARTDETRCEVSCPLTNTGTGLSVGSECLLVQNDNGDCDVVHGNVVVGRLPPEARSTIAACQQAAAVCERARLWDRPMGVIEADLERRMARLRRKSFARRTLDRAA